MIFDVKNSKSMQGTDGLIWTATIFMEGQKLCTAHDDGYGGGLLIDWHDPELEKTFKAYVASLPPVPSKIFADGWKRNVDAILGEIVDDHEGRKKMEKTLKRWCKTYIVLHFKGESSETFQRIKGIYNPLMKPKIMEKYGDKIDRIVNEEFI